MTMRPTTIDLPPSRRVFIKSGAAAMLSLGFAPSFLTRAAAATSGRKLLIAIFQRGAVDGLNMVVPYGEAEYYRLRPSIAVARPGAADGALDLNGFFGLHPRMSALMPLWTNGSLGIVHACGSPDRTRSHFDAQDYMETATPGIKSTRDGWLNRCLQVSGAGDPARAVDPLRGVAVARQTPRSLQGRAPSLAFASAGAFDVRGDMASAKAFEAAYATAADDLLKAGGRDAFEAMRTLRQAGGGTYRPAAGVEYPRSPFGQAMQEIARIAKAGVGLEIAFAESNNWDHHVAEGGAQGQIAQRLDDLATSLAALTADLGDRMADTLILTMSEFGRTVTENGNRGTDHGHGNAMMLIGGGVKGGIHGRWPGLSAEQRFESRDLAVTTDFRDVFSEVVTGHLGVPGASLGTIFPGHRAQALDLLRT
jgi:uncharacterized protein (DUF1501 family)